MSLASPRPPPLDHRTDRMARKPPEAGGPIRARIQDSLGVPEGRLVYNHSSSILKPLLVTFLARTRTLTRTTSAISSQEPRGPSGCTRRHRRVDPERRGKVRRQPKAVPRVDTRTATLQSSPESCGRRAFHPPRPCTSVTSRLPRNSPECHSWCSAFSTNTPGQVQPRSRQLPRWPR